ncbi:MAG TPA: chromate resistance protein ChrB [Peptococcaceae bacterium]|nr:MAG: ChrB domain-containing protein [Clostridia bacterium 41_269]HBT20581.1 chromate resistance protein ChrB [Peptococcaceae bacterium]
MGEKINWLLIIYKIPPEPSKHRVAVWRRLKEAGAIYLQNSVCILPDLPASRDFFQTLKEMVEKAGGESLVLLTQAAEDAEEEKIVKKFNDERDQEYGEFLEQGAAFLAEIRKETERKNFSFGELEENEGELQRLKNWLEKIKRRDFFRAQKGEKAEKMLRECEEALESFSNRVFEANEG